MPPIVNRFFTVEVDAGAGLERQWQGEAWVVTQEEIVLAPAPGKITFLVQHGQWVAPGSILAEIVDLKGDPRVVYCPCGGLVSLQPGPEPKAMMGSPRRRLAKPIDGEQVETGQQLARILRPNVICLRIQSRSTWLPVGEMSILVSEISDGTKGTTKQWHAAWLESAEDGVVNLRLVYFPAEWLDRESLSAVVKVTGPAGQRIPVRAIANHQGRQGVLIVTSSGYEFRTVEVLDRWEQEAVVSGLAPGDRVVTRPRLLLIR
ncbi:MAG: hypothetical protein GX977_09225 [Firmicutes bacterium]|nr:hypothetical protein [Bacillota bacterium]